MFVDPVLAPQMAKAVCATGTWVYRAEREDVKWTHYAHLIGDERNAIEIDFTPYALMGADTFRMMAEMGFPPRRALADDNIWPLDRDAVRAIYGWRMEAVQ